MLSTPDKDSTFQMLISLPEHIYVAYMKADWKFVSSSGYLLFHASNRGWTLADIAHLNAVLWRLPFRRLSPKLCWTRDFNHTKEGLNHIHSPRICLSMTLCSFRNLDLHSLTWEQMRTYTISLIPGPPAREGESNVRSVVNSWDVFQLAVESLNAVMFRSCLTEVLLPRIFFSLCLAPPRKATFANWYTFSVYCSEG